MRQRIVVFCLYSLATILLSSYNSEVFSQDQPLLFDEDKRYYTLAIDLFPPLTDNDRLNIYNDFKSKGYFVYYTWESIDSLNQRNIGVGRFSSISEAEEFAVTFREKENTEYSIEQARRAGKDELFYTLRIKTPTPLELGEVIPMVMNFINKGYFAFFYGSMLPLEQRRRMRLRVGLYENETEADKSAEVISNREGMSFNIDTAVVHVDKNEKSAIIVTTPYDIWSINDSKATLLYTFDKKQSLDYLKAYVSPDGKAIVFCYEVKIIKVNTDDKSVSVLLEKIPDSEYVPIQTFPQWSPSGDYIAFVDTGGFEEISSLWIMSPDGTDVRRVVTGGYLDDVKYLRWHPIKDEIFFVAGYAAGTITVGGILYRVDLKGNRKEIATADAVNGREILSSFRIVGNKLIYKVSHYRDDRYMDIYFTTHEIVIRM